MMTLVLAGIAFEAKHGATAAERRVARRFEVDVEIDANVDGAGASDRVADTVDYRHIAEAVVTVGTGGTCRLLETLAVRMLAALREICPRGSAIRIELRKPSPPGCAGNPATAAVRLSAP